MKKLFIALCVTIATYVVNASYLYWQVEDPQIQAYNATDPGEGFAYTSGAYFTIAQSGSDTAVTTIDSSTGNSVSQESVGTVYSSLVDSGYSYYIEMRNSAGSLIARSDTISSGTADWTSYANYANAITADLEYEPININIWHPTFTAVPEPTSAMLIMRGAAFLGLKRKNRRIA